MSKQKQNRQKKKMKRGNSQNVGSTPIPDEATSYGEADHEKQDQFHEAKSKHEKEIQEADKSSSTSSCGLGQGDSTPLCSTEGLVGELLSSEDSVPISSVKTQASIINATQDYHKEFPAAGGSSVLEPPISCEPYSDLGSRPSYLQIARGATVKNHNEVYRSENSAASGSSVLGIPTTSKPSSVLGSQSSDLQVGQDAIVEDHIEGTVGESCSSVSGVDATEALSDTNARNLCPNPSASNLPKSRTNLNAAQAKSQEVYGEVQEILLEVRLTMGPGTIIVLLGILLVVLCAMFASPTIDRYDLNSQFNGSRNFPSSSQGRSFPASPSNDSQQNEQDLPQSEMESTQHQEQKPDRSLDNSELHQSHMGASQGYQDQTTSSDTTPGIFEAPSCEQPRQPREH